MSTPEMKLLEAEFERRSKNSSLSHLKDDQGLYINFVTRLAFASFLEGMDYGIRETARRLKISFPE